MRLVSICLLQMVIGSNLGARILGIFPTPSISHQLPFQAVMKTLASRGHQITVISPNPLKNPVVNYTDVDISFLYSFWVENVDFNQFEQDSQSFISMLSALIDETKIWGEMCHLSLSSPVIKQFLNTKQKFDLVFIETFFSQCLFGLIHHVGSPPVIGILSFGGIQSNFESMGSPNNPSYCPETWFVNYSDRMNFWERLTNTVSAGLNKYMVNYLVLPEQERIFRQYFGNDLPSIWETERNFSLIMLNNHWSLSYPRPLLPGIIELGSLHIQDQGNPLPEDLTKFLDDAEKGFIYFSLGSNVRSDKLPEHKRRIFLDAFSELPQRVLWKWESDTLPGQPKNVKLGKWLPQQDILAHPNILLFVTQGGAQSIQEATRHSVPLVGIPFMGEQSHNMQKIVSSFAGLELDLETLTKEMFIDALKTIINNSSYGENMKRLSSINRDQPETSMERAVWWTEYVLRHNGAKHLRSAALDLSWWQYLLLDVIAVIGIAAIVLLLVAYLVVRKLVKCLCSYTKCCKLSKNETIKPSKKKQKKQ